MQVFSSQSVKQLVGALALFGIAGTAHATPVAIGLTTPVGVTTNYASNWTVAGFSSVAGANNDLGDGGFAGGQYLHTGGRGSKTVTLDLSDLPTHTGFSIGLNVAQIESVDPNRDGDLFRILVNGVELLQVGLGFGNENGFSEPLVSNYEVNGAASDINEVLNVATATGDLILGTTWTDHVYDFGALDALQNIDHTAGTLQIQIVAGTNQGFTNEAYAIDNLSVTLHGAPEPGTTLLLGGALLGLGVRMRRRLTAG